ncbi:MAG: tetratricopeptide repeat protein [Phormidesmis sp.]
MQSTSGEASLSAQDLAAEGDRLFQQQQWSAAAANYKKAIAIQPEWVLALCKLGKVSLRQAQLDKQPDNIRWAEAERWFDRALELNAKSHLANYGLAQVAMGRQAWAVAAEHLTRTIALKPGFIAAVYMDLGKVWQQLQQWEDAIAAYCTALQYGQANEIYDQLAIALCAQAGAKQ